MTERPYLVPTLPLRGREYSTSGMDSRGLGNKPRKRTRPAVSTRSSQPGQVHQPGQKSINQVKVNQVKSQPGQPRQPGQLNHVNQVIQVIHVVQLSSSLERHVGSGPAPDAGSFSRGLRAVWTPVGYALLVEAVVLQYSEGVCFGIFVHTFNMPLTCH